MGRQTLRQGLVPLWLALSAGWPAGTTATAAEPAPARAAPAKAAPAGHAAWHTFSNVRTSPRSGDCSGISVRWRRTPDTAPGADGAIALTGTLFDAGGNCPGPALDLADGRLDPRTGALSFNARSARTGRLAARFEGRWTGGELRGQFAYAREATGELTDWSRVTLRPLSLSGQRRLGLAPR